MVTATTTLDELFEMAKESTKEVEVTEGYIVKDLFRGFEWNRIPKGNRTKLGGMYFAYSNHEGATYVEPIGKTPQNQQKYIKK